MPWPGSCPVEVERFAVYRAVVLWVVLTLAAGQNAAALCSAACGRTEMAGPGCRHDCPTASDSVSGADHCGSNIAQISTVGVDTRRMGPDPSFIDVATGLPFVHSPAGTDRAALFARGSSFHGTCHLIALRI